MTLVGRMSRLFVGFAEVAALMTAFCVSTRCVLTMLRMCCMVCLSEVAEVAMMLPMTSPAKFFAGACAGKGQQRCEDQNLVHGCKI